MPGQLKQSSMKDMPFCYFYSDLLPIEEMVPQKIVRQCQKNLVKGLMTTNAQGHKYK